MSDSLKATVIVSLCVSTISAKPELLDEDDEEFEFPRLPDDVALELLEDELCEELLDDEDVVPDDTESPRRRFASETIVPLTGARSFVSASAASALCRLALALSTEAFAEAMLAALLVVLEEPDPPEPLDPVLGELDPEGVLVEPAVVIVGVVTVVVVAGVVVVLVVGVMAVVVVLVGVVVVVWV